MLYFFHDIKCSRFRDISFAYDHAFNFFEVNHTFLANQMQQRYLKPPKIKKSENYLL